VLCRVVVLRWHGEWMSRKQVLEQPGKPGVLDFRKANPAYYGRTMQARLLHIRKPDDDVLPVLQYARVMTIKEGGVMITGVELSFRGAKSKPVSTKQTWWCITEHEPGFAALERMNARSSSGFDANDDDLDD
jgi:hypothetical protein